MNNFRLEPMELAMTAHDADLAKFAASADEVRALPQVTYDQCLEGARKWLERAVAQAKRGHDAFYVETFQRMLESHDLDASDVFRAMGIDDLRDQGLDEDGNPLNSEGFPISRVSFGMHHPDSPSWGGVR